MSNHRRVNMILAIFTFLLSAFVFSRTAGPTVALWDCGEYLASAACVGIPHPPGTPLLVPMGRLFLMAFSFLKDPGFRLNMFSVLGSALTILFLYLIIIRAVILIMGPPDTSWKRVALYCGGISGALLCAFSNTFWFCSLEFSEQCNVCLLPNVITIWLSLVWAQSKDPRRDRWLLLIAYIAFTGIGMHMISEITVPAIFLFVMMYDEAKRKDWRLWVSGICLSTSMYNLSYFIVACSLIIALTLLMMLIRGPQQSKWRFCFWFSFLAMLGFSNHLYLPVRSSVNPPIDENHPVTWKAFTGTLDRKQYGSESMVTRSLHRRGTLAHQFGIEGHMGFGGFYITQFFHFSDKDTQRSFMTENIPLGMLKLLIYLLPTALMFFGWYYYYHRNKPMAVLLILVFLLTSVILTWYMNFADGLRAEHYDYVNWLRSGQQGPMPTVQREVRVRDYFWNAGFMFYSMWIGIAISCLLAYLFTNKNKSLRMTVAPLAAVLFFISPALPLTQNYQQRDRHMNWIPYDSAYNLLMSCDQDAILITNGDNDTFPLWALQEAYGIRRDVRIVNLSLLNTNWYIKQLKTLEPKVPISFTDDQIDALNAELNPFSDPTPYTLPSAAVAVTLPGRSQQNVLRVQDKLVLNIVDCNRFRKPIYFSTTVSNDNFMGLDPYLQMEGLVYRINPKVVPEDKRMDMDKTMYFLDKVYQYRSAKLTDDPADEAAHGLVTNYAAAYIQVAWSLRKPLLDEKNALDSIQKQIAAAKFKNTPEATAQMQAFLERRKKYEERLNLVIGQLNKCLTLMPGDWRPRAMLQEFLINHNRRDEAEKAAREALNTDPTNPEYIRMYAQVLEMQGKSREVIPLLKALLRRDPDYFEGCEGLVKNYMGLKEYDSALAVISAFAASHPGDRRAEQIRQELAGLAMAQQHQSPVAPPMLGPVIKQKK
ncbi:MAG: DUF2723 domain-containing protein [Chitinivibrionales bacterium]|nr:DUF2723 domain-containing protein [Chitinivibrionales bacterium]